jgi:hypothetical protein
MYPFKESKPNRVLAFWITVGYVLILVSFIALANEYGLRKRGETMTIPSCEELKACANKVKQDQ